MAKIAIDVVLLPSEAMTNKAIEANRRLLDKRIVLDKEGCLPHISLAMGCIEEDEIGEIEGILCEIAEYLWSKNETPVCKGSKLVNEP